MLLIIERELHNCVVGQPQFSSVPARLYKAAKYTKYDIRYKEEQEREKGDS